MNQMEPRPNSREHSRQIGRCSFESRGICGENLNNLTIGSCQLSVVSCQRQIMDGRVDFGQVAEIGRKETRGAAAKRILDYGPKSESAAKRLALSPTDTGTDNHQLTTDNFLLLGYSDSLHKSPATQRSLALPVANARGC